MGDYWDYGHDGTRRMRYSTTFYRPYVACRPIAIDIVFFVSERGVAQFSSWNSGFLGSGVDRGVQQVRPALTIFWAIKAGCDTLIGPLKFRWTVDPRK